MHRVSKVKSKQSHLFWCNSDSRLRYQLGTWFVFCLIYTDWMCMLSRTRAKSVAKKWDLYSYSNVCISSELFTFVQFASVSTWMIQQSAHYSVHSMKSKWYESANNEFKFVKFAHEKPSHFHIKISFNKLPILTSVSFYSTLWTMMMENVSKTTTRNNDSGNDNVVYQIMTFRQQLCNRKFHSLTICSGILLDI